jgi:hypothetical protein
MKSIESIKVAGACRKLFGVTEYAGRGASDAPLPAYFMGGFWDWQMLKISISSKT